MLSSLIGAAIMFALMALVPTASDAQEISSLETPASQRTSFGTLRLWICSSMRWPHPNRLNEPARGQSEPGQ